MLEGLTPPVRKKRCGLYEWRETLSEDDRRILDNAFADEAWSTSGLAKALMERGAPFRYQVVYRHRHNFCSCSERKQNAREPEAS